MKIDVFIRASIHPCSTNIRYPYRKQKWDVDACFLWARIL